MKKIFTTLTCLSLTFAIVNAQLPIKGNETKSKSKKFLYLGGGVFFPNSETKASSGLSKLTQFNLAGYFPVKSFRSWSIGLDLAGKYGLNNSNINPTIKTYRITGESSAPTTTQIASSSPKYKNILLGAGPAITISLSDKFIVMPAFNLVYNSFSQSNFIIKQNSTVNSTPYTWDLYLQNTKTATGKGFLPKLKLLYQFGQLGVWAEGSYLMASKAETIASTFVPEGNANANGFYSLGQINTHSYTTKTSIANFGGLAINCGISIGFGGRKPVDNQKPIKSAYNQPKTLAYDSPKIPTSTVATKPTLNDNETTQNCKEYNAPIIISPQNKENLTIKNDEIFINYVKSNAFYVNYKVSVWRQIDGKQELLHEKIYPNSFNGKISGLKLAKNKAEHLTIQIQAINCVKGNCPIGNSDIAMVQKATCTTFKNNGLSNIVSVYKTATDCSLDYPFKIDSAKCIENGKIKVFGHYSAVTTSTQNPINITLDAIASINVNATPVAASNLSANIISLPKTINPNQVYNFTFEMAGDESICAKELAIGLTFTSTLNVGTVSNPRECSNPYTCYDYYANLPCCICTFCGTDENPKPENMLIVNGLQSASLNGNNLNLNQNFTITPKQISKINAEIVSITENPVDEACRTCRKDNNGNILENEVYNFIGNNTATWSINNTPILATGSNASHLLPANSIEWKTNKQGNIDFNLNIALPGNANLSCCDRHGVICIRYTFTDVDCKSCTRLVCYNF